MSQFKDQIIQLYARSPAPSRDYYGLSVSKDFLILNVWNISHGPHVFPKRHKIPIEELPQEKTIQNEVRRLFGEHVLNFVIQLASKEVNLHHLPSKIFCYILKHLAANDILKLSQTSKIFFELCNTNMVWQIIYSKKIKTNREDLKHSEIKSWKDVLKNKLCKKLYHTAKNIAQKSNASSSTNNDRKISQNLKNNAMNTKTNSMQKQVRPFGDSKNSKTNYNLKVPEKRTGMVSSTLKTNNVKPEQRLNSLWPEPKPEQRERIVSERKIQPDSCRTRNGTSSSRTNEHELRRTITNGAPGPYSMPGHAGNKILKKLEAKVSSETGLNPKLSKSSDIITKKKISEIGGTIASTQRMQELKKIQNNLASRNLQRPSSEAMRNSSIANKPIVKPTTARNVTTLDGNRFNTSSEIKLRALASQKSLIKSGERIFASTSSLAKGRKD